MTQLEMKQFILRSVQQPLRIHVTDGASYKVTHPDFAFVTSGSLILASGPGHDLGMEFVVRPLAQISRVEVLKQKANPAGT